MYVSVCSSDGAIEEFHDVECVTVNSTKVDGKITIDAFDGTKAEYDTAEWSVQSTAGSSVQKPQRQDALVDQLRDTVHTATYEGCYDAADAIKRVFSL